MAGIKRRKNESFEAFMRRVKKRWQQSGKLIQVKKIRFHTDEKGKNMRRKSALHRLRIGSKMAYLKKIGKLVEEKKRR